MTNSTDKRFQRGPQRRTSSLTGWITGAVIVLLAIAAVWFYGIRSSDDVTSPGTTSSTKTNPPESTAPPVETGTGGSTTAPAPAPAPAPPPVTP
jgi:hypothetical protein